MPSVYRKLALDLTQLAIKESELGQEELGELLEAELGGHAKSHQASVADWSRRVTVPSTPAFLALLKVTGFAVEPFLEAQIGYRRLTQTEKLARLARQANRSRRQKP